MLLGFLACLLLPLLLTEAGAWLSCFRHPAPGNLTASPTLANQASKVENLRSQAACSDLPTRVLGSSPALWPYPDPIWFLFGLHCFYNSDSFGAARRGECWSCLTLPANSECMAVQEPVLAEELLLPPSKLPLRGLWVLLTLPAEDGASTGWKGKDGQSVDLLLTVCGFLLQPQNE